MTTPKKKNTTLQDFAARIKEASAAKQKEMEAQEVPPGPPPPAKPDLNVLPLPDRQEILPQWIQWTWQATNNIKIFGILYIQDCPSSDHTKGDYEVQVSLPVSCDVATLSTENAHALGHALLSASNYKNVWKDHAGTMIEKEILNDVALNGEVVDVVVDSNGQIVEEH